MNKKQRCEALFNLVRTERGNIKKKHCERQRECAKCNFRDSWKYGQYKTLRKEVLDFFPLLLTWSYIRSCARRVVQSPSQNRWNPTPNCSNFRDSWKYGQYKTLRKEVLDFFPLLLTWSYIRSCARRVVQSPSQNRWNPTPNCRLLAQIMLWQQMVVCSTVFIKYHIASLLSRMIVVDKSPSVSWHCFFRITWTCVEGVSPDRL